MIVAPGPYAQLIGCAFGNRRGFAASGVSKAKPTHLIKHHRFACGTYVDERTIASATTIKPGAWCVDGAAVTNPVSGMKTLSSPQASTKGCPTRMPSIFAANSAADKHTHIADFRWTSSPTSLVTI